LGHDVKRSDMQGRRQSYFRAKSACTTAEGTLGICCYCGNLNAGSGSIKPTTIPTCGIPRVNKPHQRGVVVFSRFALSWDYAKKDRMTFEYDDDADLPYVTLMDGGDNNRVFRETKDGEVLWIDPRSKCLLGFTVSSFLTRPKRKLEINIAGIKDLDPHA
jgi:uncharacterized protein YuzE